MRKGTSHFSQLNRLRRIEGQVRGVSKMVEDQKYCIDILNQIKAIRSALRSVESVLIEEHLGHCVHNAVVGRDHKESMRMIREIQKVLKSQ